MKRSLFAVLLCCLILPGLMMAQGVTSAAFNGLITDVDGNPIVGAAISALHTPTGTVYTAISRIDGLFNIPAVKVGGPYKVTVKMDPFKTQEITGITLKLGEDRNLKFKLALETIAEEITVIASNPIISESRTGAAQNVSTAIIESMPSIGRSFDDFARLAPQVDSRGSGAFSAAGRSSRYNDIKIDGAVNNDLFGLGSSGTPGLAAPISLDAVQEFQLVIAPYDVRQGGFTGSSLNAITRSGTNTFSGSAYYFGRNQDFVGKGPSNKDYGTFSEKQYGFRLGGPVIKDKLFFFLSGEMGKTTSPTNWIIDDSNGPTDFGGKDVTKADADRFVSILKTKYNFDAGGYGQGFRKMESSNDKLFVRLDYNISDKHRLTLRHNYVTGDSDRNASAAGSAKFSFADNFYTLNNKTNSTVAQLNSTLGANLFNELTLNYTTIRDIRDTNWDKPFPHIAVEIKNKYFLMAGTEQYSAANALDQDIIELTDNLTWYKGKHTFTLGTHNEFFNFSNLFIRDYYGYWEFTSLDNFEKGTSSYYSHSFFTTDPSNKWYAKFGVMQLGAYVGDNWAVLPNLTLTLGARLDVPIINDTPTANPVVEQIYQIKTDQSASGNLLFSPRIGFNWDVNKDKKTQVRGGIGIFAGRTPYVWISNQFSNTGIELTRISGTPKVPFVSDVDKQPVSGFSASLNEVDLIDKNFTYPQLLRTNLAIDKELPMGIIGTLEFIYSKNIDEILYQNLNLVDQNKPNPDGRPTYKKTKSPQFSDVIYLTNTNKGYQYSISAQFQKSFNKNSWANLTYTYGEAKDVNSGVSAQAYSQWRYNPIGANPNDPALVWSNYDVRHRVGAAVSYTFNFLKNAPTSVGVFYGGRSGRPYSTTYNYTDANGDGSRDNDLVFVPATINDVVLTDSAGVALTGSALTTAWAALDAFIAGDPGLDKYRGSIVPRNASREPWYHSVDARLAQDIPIPGLKDNRLQITLDVVNMLNLFNKSWGKLQYVYNQNDVPFTYKGIDTASNKIKMQYSDRTNYRYLTSDLSSRWQMQLGLRYSFN